MALKICLFCKSQEWIDADYLRAEPANMVVCKECGFITFKRFRDDDDYKNYYDKDYRKSNVVNTNNIVTTNRKIGYHEKFLSEWFTKKKAELNRPIIVGEIGAGIGYFLKWAKDRFGCEVSGSELTGIYRNYAKNAMGIDLTIEFDFEKKYDLISCYHTIEHIPEPDVLLKRLRGCLNPGGVLYIATPIWMEELMRWGGGTFTTFDEHFHPDHINAWSRSHFEWLLDITGWYILSENRQMYGWTMLLEPGPPDEHGVDKDILPDGENVMEQLEKMQRAITAYRKNNFSEAISIYPQFVDAYMGEIEKASKDFSRQMEICDAGQKACQNVRSFQAQKGMILYQYDRLDEAHKELIDALEAKPHDQGILLHLAMISLKIGEAQLKTDYKKGKDILKIAVNIFDKIIMMNPTAYAQCYDYIAYVFSICPSTEPDSSKDLEFVAPASEGAPHIDLVKHGA